MTDDIEKLLAFGRIGLETGYYEQARDNFERVLALDPSNREAMEGLGRANEVLRRRGAVKPSRQREPVRPLPMAEPQRTVPEWRTPEWRGSPVQESQEQSRLDNREDSMEFKADDNLEWLSLQLKHVPIKTWMIVLAKMGVAYMVLMAVLAFIVFVSSLVLAKIGISVLEMLGGL